MNCYQPLWLKDQKIFVPCGHCFSCRQAKASEWSVRLLLELSSWKKAGFLTLTYRTDTLPPNGSLRPEELTLFFKRLRKALSSVGRKLKYFACGEYGLSSLNKNCKNRPHYHAVVFGISPSISDRALVHKIWNKGRTSIDYVNRKTINYVCGYVLNKYGRKINDLYYKKIGRVVPFQRTSRGLGLDYALSHAEELSRQLSVRLFTGRECPLPKYFVDKLGIDKERLKEKSKDSMQKYVSAIFKRAGLKSCTDVGHLGYMLFYSKDFRSFDKLSNAFNEINEQMSYNVFSLREKH